MFTYYVLICAGVRHTHMLRLYSTPINSVSQFINQLARLNNTITITKKLLLPQVYCIRKNFMKILNVIVFNCVMGHYRKSMFPLFTVLKNINSDQHTTPGMQGLYNLIDACHN